MEAAESTPTFAVDEDGNVNAAEDYDGPRIVKIRVLTEGNFLEIYWDRYVDENEAIDVDNFVLKNGDTKNYSGKKKEYYEYYGELTNTLYFDKENQENCCDRRPKHGKAGRKSAHVKHLILVERIDISKGLTLEVSGATN